MMSYLKFVLVFLFELLKNNIVKLLILTGVIVSFSFADTFKDDINTYDVATVVQVDNKYIYVCRTIEDNKVKYENVWNDKEIPLKDGKISITSYAFANGFMWFCFIILSVVFIILTIIGINDDDIGWDFEDSWREAFGTLIYCEEEEGQFYYFALGRLISKRDRQVNRDYKITRELRIGGFRDLFCCPRYQTKNQRRESLLNKIGIN